jgi:peptide/nickel transport system permease protein
MWPYITRRLLYSIPVYLGIIVIVMGALRVNDPVAAYLGKNASEEQIRLKRTSMGLDDPFLVQYAKFLKRIATLDFGSEKNPYESWKFEGQQVSTKISESVWPTLAHTVPSLVITTIISIGVSLLSAYYRGSVMDRTLMVLVVLGMSVSVLVFIILGQYFGAYWLTKELGVPIFATGYDADQGLRAWRYNFALPVLITVVVAMGYDTRFYRSVMVEETGKDYITTAIAKGATRPKIMCVHMLKNAMIPVITRIMITLPFLLAGSFLIESQFRIPGMGKLLLDAITNKDFPIIQAFTAIFAGVFILTNILTDVMYALVDPRVRLS